MSETEVKRLRELLADAIDKRDALDDENLRLREQAGDMAEAIERDAAVQARDNALMVHARLYSQVAALRAVADAAREHAITCKLMSSAEYLALVAALDALPPADGAPTLAQENEEAMHWHNGRERLHTGIRAIVGQRDREQRSGDADGDLIEDVRLAASRAETPPQPRVWLPGDTVPAGAYVTELGVQVRWYSVPHVVQEGAVVEVLVPDFAAAVAAEQARRAADELIVHDAGLGLYDDEKPTPDQRSTT